MKLGFDIDEVVANMSSEMSKYVKKKYDIDFNVSDYKSYKIQGMNFPNTADISEEDIKIDLLEKVHDPAFQAKAKPYKEAVKCIKLLKRVGHSVHFITCRNIGAEYEVAKWFRKHHVLFDSIHNIGRHKEKGPLGRLLNLDFYMDDLVKHLESMLKYKKRWRKGLGLLTKSWNSDPIDTSKFIRLDDWVQVSRHLGIHKR